MAVLGYREVIPRTFEHRIGESPSATRVFIATVDSPTSSSEVIGAIGIQHGSRHPEYSALSCLSYSLDETDRQHVTVSYAYGVRETEEGEEGGGDAPPWLQPDRWTFGTSNASVPCTQYFPENLPGGVDNISHPLVNSAGDAIFGVTRAEPELKITISGSRLEIDLPKYLLYVGAINKEKWAGFLPHTVQCVGFSASPDRLEWQGIVLDYWQINFELIYRPSTHDIFLPQVGWNVIVNGKKQRAWTYIEDNGIRERVPAPHPVALNEQGGFLCGPGQDEAQDWEGGTNTPDDGTSYY